jgi:hypothetical protein
MELGNYIYLSSGLFGGPDNSLSGFARTIPREQEVVHKFPYLQIREPSVTSCGPAYAGPPGQQVVRATRMENTEVIVLGEEN